MNNLQEQFDGILKNYQAEVARIEFWNDVKFWTFSIVGFVVFCMVLNYFRRIEQHLKKLSDAVSQSSELQNGQSRGVSSHTSASNPASKPHCPPRSDQIDQQLHAKVQSVHADSSEHPHAQYMPKS